MDSFVKDGLLWVLAGNRALAVSRAQWQLAGQPWVEDAFQVIEPAQRPTEENVYGLVYARDGSQYVLGSHRRNDLPALAARLTLEPGQAVAPAALAEVVAWFGAQGRGVLVEGSVWGPPMFDRFPAIRGRLKGLEPLRIEAGAGRVKFSSYSVFPGGPQLTVAVDEWQIEAVTGGDARIQRRRLAEVVVGAPDEVREIRELDLRWAALRLPRKEKPFDVERIVLTVQDVLYGPQERTIEVDGGHLGIVLKSGWGQEGRTEDFWITRPTDWALALEPWVDDALVVEKDRFQTHSGPSISGIFYADDGAEYVLGHGGRDGDPQRLAERLLLPDHQAPDVSALAEVLAYLGTEPGGRYGTLIEGSVNSTPLAHRLPASSEVLAAVFPLRRSADETTVRLEFFSYVQSRHAFPSIVTVSKWLVQVGSGVETVVERREFAVVTLADEFGDGSVQWAR
ncbi:hypothetical protein [Kineosporia babensis]|uniref:Uncharacterized protein n=1 Tax=Kineosporia babensis TaxID=499548 RepID=A0A9X1SSU4_9ACTN|nr:hypothetical protein [Kineosporia babensis]MCD5309985.1 hypothetical protein [Kineosporia babensis]